MTFYDLNMNNKRVENAQDPTNAQDLATKNYIDSILSGFMKQVKVERFTANGTFVVPVGATYAVAHIMGGGAGMGGGGSGAGGNSSVDFVSGIVTATGGAAYNVQFFGSIGLSSAAGAANSGNGASSSGVESVGSLNSNSNTATGQNGAYIVAGADVAFGQSIAVVVGLGGTAGTDGAAGGSGYVWIEYY